MTAHGRLSPLQVAVLEAFFATERGFFLSGGAALAGFHLQHRAKDGGCTPATLAWLLTAWRIPSNTKLPVGYTAGGLQAFKEQLAERMAIAAHPG